MQASKLLPMLILLQSLLAPLHGKAEVRYTLNVLPENFFPADINNAGQIAGNIFLNELGAHAAVYSGGAITDLGTFSGMFSEAVAINEAGTVVGNAGFSSGPWSAFIYGNGSTQEIAGMYGLDINAGGDIVGQTHTGTGALYRQGILSTVGYLGTGNFSTATAINDAGHIVGTSTIDLETRSRQHPFLYRDGMLHDLGTLDEREFNSAVAINNAGQIAGYSEGTGGGMHAFFYENGVMTDLGSFGGLNLDVGGMNAHGDIVGTGDPWEGSPIAFVSRNGTLVDLNTLIDPSPGWTIDRAIDINDDGQIIGIACRDFTCSPVRLDLASAVPEPGGALLSLFGLLMLASARLRLPRRRCKATAPPEPDPRRAVMLMQKYGALLALLAVLLAPMCSHAGAVYAVTRLPEQFHPSDLNNAGQMSGALYAANGSVHAAVYDAGRVVDLGTFGATYSYANAMNDTGAVAGNFGPAGGPEHAFLYRNGVLHDIGNGNALGMNASGDVVGQRYTATGATGFLYTDGRLADVGQLGHGNVSRATAINDAGQVVGESNLAFNEQVPTLPFLYDNGSLHHIDTLAEHGVNSAMAINNAGQVAGYGDAGDGRMHVFFYERGTLTDLGHFGGLDVTIGGMNALGQVVGTGNTRDGPDVAFISRDGALVDLNTLIDPATGWSITSALDINDHGQVIAYACHADTCSAVRLDVASAVPEPARAVLMVPCLLAMLGLRARRLRRRAQT